MPTVEQLVRDLFAGDAVAIDDETPFAAVAGWDSLKHVELIVAIETGFGVELTADEIEQLTCTRAAREVLARRIGA